MRFIVSLCLLMCLSSHAFSQENVVAGYHPLREIKLNLTDDGSRYVKVTFMNQVWLRWNESNQGTLVNGQPADNTFDIGLRRTRIQFYGQLSERVFFYMQYGLNNFNYLSQQAGNRKLHAFFHDALGEFKVSRTSDKLKIGAGLSIISGLSRFTQPGVSSIMTADVPVFLQTTVDQTDQFARKLSVYARGQLGKLDYRLVLSDPFPVQTNGQPAPAISENASFSTYGHSHQFGGLFIWNFFDSEPHTTPYMAGTYLGDKKILNIEAGAIYQDRAMWRLAGSDTTFDPMTLWSVAAFADLPLKGNRYAVSAYAGYFNTDYGSNYIRNNGIMNPANGSSNPMAFSGGGNAYPMFGTGSSIYTQAGVRLPQGLFGNLGTLQPYVSWRSSSYERLEDPVNVYNIGVNWLMKEQFSKVSLNYELRPEFRTATDGSINKTGNAGSAWLQYQVLF